MKLSPTTPLNEAIRRLSQGEHRAATVLGLITRDYPERAIEYMRAMDRLEIYGIRIAALFWGRYNANLVKFLDYLTRKSRGK